MQGGGHFSLSLSPCCVTWPLICLPNGTHGPVKVQRDGGESSAVGLGVAVMLRRSTCDTRRCPHDARCAAGARAACSLQIPSPHQGARAAGAAGTVPALLTDDGSDRSVSWDVFSPLSHCMQAFHPCNLALTPLFLPPMVSFCLGITSIIPACVGRGFLTDHPQPAQQCGLWLGCSDAGAGLGNPTLLPSLGAAHQLA